jgi:hypothetical protein
MPQEYQIEAAGGSFRALGRYATPDKAQHSHRQGNLSGKFPRRCYPDAPQVVARKWSSAG